MVEIRRTLCNRDCPDACSIEATIDGGRVVALRGDKDHSVTQGFLCFRTNQFLRSQYAPDRLTTPLLRREGRLEPVSWDEALRFIAERLLAIRAESGPSAILHYRSGGTLGVLAAQASDLFFEQFGPTAVKRGDICSGAGEAAQEADFGVSDSSDLSELERARHVILWGKNVATSSPHTIPVLKRAKENGASLVMIDCVHNRSAELCDAFVQPRPGGDFSLAMAVLQVVFEKGWVAPDAATYCQGLAELRTLASRNSLAAWCRDADVTLEAAVDLAQRLHDGPTTILVGWGMARRTNGGAIVRALDALAAVTGNIGIPGAGVSFYFRRRRAFGSLLRGLAPPRTICEPLFAQELLAASSPEIRAVWITAGNPVAMLPESGRIAEALLSRELVVVVDRWLSDTASVAHVVLPVNTLLEADDLVGAYGHHYLGATLPVVPSPDGVKSDLEIFQALAVHVGQHEYPQGTARELKERLVGQGLRDQGVTLATLEEKAVRNPLAAPVLFEGRRFATPDAKVHLISDGPSDFAEGDREFPLWLLSLSTPKSQSSQWAKAPPKLLDVTVHPSAAVGIANGGLGWLESRVGRLKVTVIHDAKQRRDVALVPKGGHYRDGSAANAIIAARLTDLGEGGALYEERVRLVGRDA